jgi:hypothetical protein
VTCEKSRRLEHESRRDAEKFPAVRREGAAMNEIVRFPARDPGLPSITCLSFQPANKPGVLKGWADLHLPRMKMRLHGCPVFYAATSNSAWAGLPSRETGKDQEGKPRFAAMVEWDSRAINDAFSRAAIAAVDAYYGPAWRDDP